MRSPMRFGCSVGALLRFFRMTCRDYKDCTARTCLDRTFQSNMECFEYSVKYFFYPISRAYLFLWSDFKRGNLFYFWLNFLSRLLASPAPSSNLTFDSCIYVYCSLWKDRQPYHLHMLTVFYQRFPEDSEIWIRRVSFCLNLFFWGVEVTLCIFLDTILSIFSIFTSFPSVYIQDWLKFYQHILWHFWFSDDHIDTIPILLHSFLFSSLQGTRYSKLFHGDLIYSPFFWTVLQFSVIKMKENLVLGSCRLILLWFEKFLSLYSCLLRPQCKCSNMLIYFSV